jgi:hypothetical protein
MKQFLILLLIVISLQIAYGKELINEASISIVLPNKKWELKDKQNTNGMNVYYFKREPIKDSLDRDVIPNISIIVEKINDSLDIVSYSILKRMKVNYNVDKVFIHDDGINNFVNAIGYKGSYTDQFGEHTIYVIYAINNQKGIQIFFDVLSCLFDKLDPEFQITLKSLKIE